MRRLDGAANMPRTMTLPPTTTGPGKSRDRTAERSFARAADAATRIGRATRSSWAAKASGAKSASAMGGRAYTPETSWRSASARPVTVSVGVSIPLGTRAPRPVSAVSGPLAVQLEGRPLLGPPHVQSKNRRRHHREASPCRRQPDRACPRESAPRQSRSPRSGHTHSARQSRNGRHRADRVPGRDREHPMQRACERPPYERQQSSRRP